MDDLNGIILESREKTASDEEFIKEMNGLIAKYGLPACASFFSVLAGLDLPVETTRDHWKALQKHGKELRERLGRGLDLATVLCDYLHTATKLVNHTRLMEIGSYEKIVNDSVHDSLTGLANRAHFATLYEQQIALARRYGSDLSLLFLDIDNFKDINDNYGHIAGDIALKTVADIINHEKRDSDIAARYGGEEFVAMMPQTSSVSGYVLAERIRHTIEKKLIHYNNLCITLTVSGGLASFPLNSQDPCDLLRMADEAVYLAKGAGKNTISLYKHEKRRYLRVALNQPVLVQELSFQATAVYPGIVKDIGIGGILFENPVFLPVGTRIKVSVSMADNVPLFLIGTVVRVRAIGPNNFEIGMSVSFKEMERSASKRIGDLLRQSEVSDSNHEQLVSL